MNKPDHDRIALTATREWLGLAALTAEGRGEDVTDALAAMEPDELLSVLLWGLNGVSDLLRCCADIPRHQVAPLLRRLARDIDDQEDEK